MLRWLTKVFVKRAQMPDLPHSRPLDLFYPGVKMAFDSAVTPWPFDRGFTGAEVQNSGGQITVTMASKDASRLTVLCTADDVRDLWYDRNFRDDQRAFWDLIDSRIHTALEPIA